MAIATAPYFEPGWDLNCVTITADIVGGTFVKVGGTGMPDPALGTTTDGGFVQAITCPAGQRATGVSDKDAIVGKPFVAKGVPGLVVQMIADGAIAVGADIEVGTAGKPKTFGSGIVVGQALSAAAGGAAVLVRLK